MKKRYDMKIRWLLLLVLSFGILALDLVSAELIDPEEITALTGLESNVGENMSALQPVVDTIQPFFKKLSVLVGGIFGLYFILIIIRVYYERKNVKLLEDIRYDLDHLNAHYDLANSSKRKSPLIRFIEYLRERARNKKEEKEKENYNDENNRKKKKSGKK